jgi:3-oxoacyl-[acyl-carrier-protein] synthase-1
MILDKDHCKPFDAERRGINLGEGAAYLVLESKESLAKSNRKPLCELKGWANANDAYHQTASSPDGNGAYLAISKAIIKSGLNPEDIDYINAHGTGTDNNDLSEGIAIERIFGNKVPPISSTKPLTGHTLGASGAIEAVLSVLAIQNKLIYPNLNFDTKIHELSFTPNTELRTNAIVRNVLSNSFGFGGNNTSLIFSAID